MRHLIRFRSINEGTLNEVYGKRVEHADRNETGLDPDLKELLGKVNDIIENSPITFNMELGQTDFTVSGPFGISMRIDLEKSGDRKAGARAVIDKTVISAQDSGSLWDQLSKSLEFKQFIKGEKLEKLRESKLKAIIKDGKDKSLAEQNALMLDYLYYSNAEMIRHQRDSASPYTTKGISVKTYKYDITPIVKAWGGDIMKGPKLENEEAKEIYNYMVRKVDGDDKSGRGRYQGKLSHEALAALEAYPLIDVDDLGEDLYDVYTITPAIIWNNKLTDIQKEVTDKLEFKNKYLVDEEILKYGVEAGANGEMTLAIKVKTTVWYN